jgi:hypothetical protein
MLLFLSTVINFGICNLTSAGAKNYANVNVVPDTENRESELVSTHVQNQ